jgi:hypothetical protein
MSMYVKFIRFEDVLYVQPFYIAATKLAVSV